MSVLAHRNKTSRIKRLKRANRLNEPITFWVARGCHLDTSLVAGPVFNVEDLDEYGPNMNWQCVRTQRQHVQSWINAMNSWLSAAWTPNQSREYQRETSRQMKRTEAIMASLEV